MGKQTKPIERSRLTILEGDVRTMLQRVPDESIHCAVTSVPYYGLRDYRLVPQLWGGDPKCRHRFTNNGHRRSRPDRSTKGKDAKGNGAFGSQRGQQPSKAARGSPSSFGDTCSHCGCWRGSLGLEPTIDMWLEHLVEILAEVRRVLRSDGTLWLNCGDAYANDYKWGGATGGKHATSLHGSQIGRGKRATGLKPKELMGLPWLLAFALRNDGWCLRSEIIWKKPTVMPSSQKDRPTVEHEQIFLLTKNWEPIFWTHRDGEGIREKPRPDWRWLNAANGEEVNAQPENWRESRIACPECRGTGRADIAHETPLFGETTSTVECDRCKDSSDHTIPKWKRINLWEGDDYFYDWMAIQEPSSADTHARYGRGRSDNHKYVDGGPGNQTIAKSFNHMIRKAGVNPKAIKEQGRADQGLRTSDRFGRGAGWRVKQNESFSAPVKDVVGMRNKRTVWTIAAEPLAEAHFAAFPSELPRICILAGTSARGCCPDCGGPYKRIVQPSEEYAKKLGRDWADYEKDSIEGRGHSVSKQRPTKRGEAALPDYETIGWQPTCACDAGEPAPCTVADPFAGSGRTGRVALELGRRAVLIELSSEYVKIIKRQCSTTFGLPLV